eukprot:14074957-Alexandrium_andersonii.AAC.1
MSSHGPRRASVGSVGSVLVCAGCARWGQVELISEAGRGKVSDDQGGPVLAHDISRVGLRVLTCVCSRARCLRHVSGQLEATVVMHLPPGARANSLRLGA